MKSIAADLLRKFVLLSPLLIYDGSACAHEFTEQNLFIAYVKLVSPQDMTPYNEVYAERFAPKASGIAGEFGQFDQKANAEKILSRNLKAFDLNEAFTVTNTAELGRYDLERQTFEFRPVSAATVYRSGAGYGPMSRIEVVFTNTKAFTGLAMEPGSARTLVEGMPSYSRRVAIDLEFRATSAAEGSDRIRSVITRIDVYSDESRRKKIGGLVPNGS